MEIIQTAVQYQKNNITAKPYNVAKVMDLTNDKLIRQIPPDSSLKISKSFIDLYA